VIYSTLGGFGYDFSNSNIDIEEALQKTAAGLLKYGVTAFCPTLVKIFNYSFQKIISIKTTLSMK